MLLQILDTCGEKEEKNEAGVEVRFFREGSFGASPDEQYFATYYPSPFWGYLRELLHWYFKDYLADLDPNKTDKNIVEKLIRLGSDMSDKLLGEDHELIKIAEIIADGGAGQLDVRIESSNPDFFREFWEVLVLHESKYILSSCVRSFVRIYQEEASAVSADEMDFELSIDAPLKILNVISGYPQDKFGESAVFGTFVSSLCAGGKLDYEIFPVQDYSELVERLAQGDFHILHYCGPVYFEKQEPTLLIQSWQAGETSVVKVPLSVVADTLHKNALGLLLLEISEYSDERGEVPTDLGLALSARVALKHGFKNVVGMASLADAWTNGLCFQTFYEKLAGGLDVGQAVVETRKALQARATNNNFTGKAFPFHAWPLLIHYGAGRRVKYFTRACQFYELTKSTAYADIRKHLYGFRSELLPPNSIKGGEKDLLQALVYGRNSRPVFISGDPGSGKTRLCHQLAFYLGNKLCNLAFYFDFSEHQYCPQTIRNMIAPVLEKEKNGPSDVGGSQDRCLFVFENVCFESGDVIESSLVESQRKLIAFFASLASESNILVFTGLSEKCNALFDAVKNISKVELKPLTLLEQMLVAAPMLRKYGLESECNMTSYPKLLRAVDGNPFLTEKVVALLRKDEREHILQSIEKIVHSAKEDRADCESNSIVKNTNVVVSYYEWRWQEIGEIWKFWLMQFAELPDVMLEMVGIVCDRHEGWKPALTLFESIHGPERIKFSDGIAVMDRSGFLEIRPYGKVIAPGAVPFLKVKKSQAQHDRPKEEMEKMDVLVSQVICEGLRTLVAHLLNNPNPDLTHSVIVNRSLWVTHMERLWFAAEYRGFLSIYNQLSQMMRQYGLSEEMGAWSLDLVSRTEKFGTVEINDMEKMLANLSVSAQALGQAEMSVPAFFAASIVAWQKWIDDLAVDEVKNYSAIFYHCIQFLELVYKKKKDIEGLRHISKVSYAGYKYHHVWPRALPHLSTLIECCVLLGDVEAGVEYEKELVEEVSHKQLPPGAYMQLIAQVAANRILRNDAGGAQRLVDMLRSQREATQFEIMIDALQADLDFQQENLTQAMELYCKLWKLSAEGHSQLNKAHIGAQLIALNAKVGDEKFDEIFKRIAGLEIVKPVSC